MQKMIERGDETIKVGSQAYTAEKIMRFIAKATPLSRKSLDKYSTTPSLCEPAFNPMNEYERRIALLFMERGLIVYREIPISTSGVNVDFFVFNPKSGRGKLVEVTLIKSKYGPREKLPNYKTRKRKSRQLILLKAIKMPFVVLYKENLESIRKYLDENLF